MATTTLPQTVLWSPGDVDFVFNSYVLYENKFVDILKVFPLTPQNENSWSPELVNIFLDVSSMVDSISRKIVSQGLNENQDVTVDNGSGGTVTKKVKALNVIDFENSFFSPSNLATSRVVVYTYPIQIRTPFDNYRNTDGWWNIYNSLKHNRITNYRNASLKNTLLALGALFLLLVRYREEEFTKALLRLKFLRTNFVPEVVHSERSSPNNFWYDSQLFGVSELPENIPSDVLADIPSYLGSEKFHLFIGRYNS